MWNEKHFTPEMEEKWEHYWEEKKIYKFDPELKGEWYVIDSPPPFTSGELHMGHVLSYSYFDFAARYMRMCGKNVFYPQGWDTQGFPTEVKVEAKYGKKDAQTFLKLCIDWTENCIEKMRAQMKRMGFSPDWDYEYKTLSPDYHKMVQKSILRMHKTGDIYRGKHPVYYCWKCMSALAKTDTEDVEEETTLNYLSFILLTESGEKELIIATTRPELVHACVAVCFHPEDERYKNLEVKGVLTPLGKKVPFIPDNDVEKEFGTGVVMVCTFGDKQDVIWWHRHRLEYIEAFNAEGKIVNSGLYDNLSILDARKKIIEELKHSGKWIKAEKLKHFVKIHDRCKTPVELRLSLQWFAKIKGHEQEIMAAAKSMRWYPEFAVVNMLDWIKNLEWDWVISRQRIFGTPLPFWYCKKCNLIETPEESELPVDPRMQKRMCKNCGSELEGEVSVCDCWVDSSITPLVIAKWETDEEFFAKAYPSTLRPQGLEIVRTWAFYTTYRCLLLTGKPPFKELLINGNVLAPDGKKMSKSLGNVIQPDELVKQYTADAVRQWAAMSGAMAKDRPFSYEDIMFAKKFINKLWNASKYVYLHRNNFVSGKEIANEQINNHLDVWIVSKLKATVRAVREAYDKYEYQKAIRTIHEFFWFDFCDYYLEATKNRAYSKNDEIVTKIYTYILEIVLRLLAPIAPHVTEEIYQRFRKVDSIHKLNFPEVAEVELLESKCINRISEDFEQKLKELVQKVWKIKKDRNLLKIERLKLMLNDSIYQVGEDLNSIFRAKEYSFVNANDGDSEVLEMS